MPPSPESSDEITPTSLRPLVAVCVLSLAAAGCPQPQSGGEGPATAAPVQDQSKQKWAENGAAFLERSLQKELTKLIELDGLDREAERLELESRKAAEAEKRMLFELKMKLQMEEQLRQEAEVKALEEIKKAKESKKEEEMKAYFEGKFKDAEKRRKKGLPMKDNLGK